MTAEKSVLVPLAPDEHLRPFDRAGSASSLAGGHGACRVAGGRQYRWTITPGHTASGTITEVEPGKRIVFTWGWEDSEDLPPELRPSRSLSSRQREGRACAWSTADLRPSRSLATGGLGPLRRAARRAAAVTATPVPTNGLRPTPATRSPPRRRHWLSAKACSAGSAEDGRARRRLAPSSPSTSSWST